MRALRSFLRRLRPPRRQPNPPRVDYSYTVFWTKQVRGWDAGRRATMREALLKVLAQADFETNAYERRYRVPGLDEQAHAGASLAALNKVLEAFDPHPPPPPSPADGGGPGRG